MKRSGIMKLIILLLVFMLVIPTYTGVVYAGESKIIVNNNSITKNGINSGNWYYKDVEIKKNHAYFNNKSSLFSAKTRILNLKEYEIEDCFKADFTIEFSSISNDGLVVGFGVEKINFANGLRNALEMKFKKSGAKVGLEINLHDSNDNLETLSTSEYLLNEDILFNVEISSYGKIIIGSKQKTTTKTLVDVSKPNLELSGYFGFQSSIGTVAILNSIDVTFYYYENATNVIDAVADFNNGYFDSNVWYSSHCNIVDYPESSMNVVDGELLMNNVMKGVFGTVYSYSNFEFCFDITKIRQNKFVDENGVEYPAQGYMGVGMGIEPYDQDHSKTVQNELWFEIDRDNGRYILYRENRNNQYIAYDIKPFASGYNFWSESDVDGRVINNKFSIINGVFSYYVKYEDEQWNNTPVFTYDLGFTPYGSVRFTGDFRYNYLALDNISIKNLDKNAEDFAVSVDYKQNITSYEKVVYNDTWNASDLLADETTFNSGCSSSINSFTVIPSLIGLTCIMLIKIVREKNK